VDPDRTIIRDSMRELTPEAQAYLREG